MSRNLCFGHCVRLLTRFPVLLILLTTVALNAAFGAPTTNDPLDPLPGVTGELIYYYDYSAVPVTTPFGSAPGAAGPLTKVTSDQRLIEDRSGNGHHLINFDPTDVILSEEIDADYAFTPITAGDFALPGARAFDTLNGPGGITQDENPMTHQGISDFGGYTFESFFKRTSAAAGVYNLWNPEGMHSLELRPSTLLFPARPANGDLNGNMHLQFALRSISNIAIDVDDVLPLDEWVHIMAVLKVETPLPNGGSPITSPLVAGYELFVDGESLVHTDDKGTPLDTSDDLANPLPPADLNSGDPFSTLELESRHHGIGTQEFGSPEGSSREFPGELAMTRLTYGALTPEQSLFNFDIVEDADFDADGDVDGADFLSWQRGDGDANGNGTSDAADLAVWESQYGVAGSLSSVMGSSVMASSVMASSVTATVPEPSTLLLLLTGLLVLRRRNH